MRIDELRIERDNEWTTVSARLIWEDNDRPNATIRFQIGESLAEDVACNANAFLVATAVPAMYYGERRLAIDGEVCPVLHDGIQSVLTQLREWYDRSRVIPVIEPSKGFQTSSPRLPGRTAQFFSGGVDALTTLRRNRLMYPGDHPRSIRDGLFVFGFHSSDFAEDQPVPERVASWERALERMGTVAGDAGIELHPLRTNAWNLFDDGQLVLFEYHSAMLCSLGHLLSRRWSDLVIASSDYVGDIGPWGSHPLIDPQYSNSGLRIHHDGVRLNRLQKVGVLSEWPEALSTLNVCIRNEPSKAAINCGTCPKCLRTMTGLLIHGGLRNASTFAADDVDPALIRGVYLQKPTEVAFWEEFLEPLKNMGRHDLVAAIHHLMADYHARQRRQAGRGLKPKIKKFDDTLLGGAMQRAWKTWHQAPVNKG